MTAQRPQIRPGEFIEIEQLGQYQTYEVDDIEYYGEPADIWRAVLHRNS